MATQSIFEADLISDVPKAKIITINGKPIAVTGTIVAPPNVSILGEITHDDIDTYDILMAQDRPFTIRVSSGFELIVRDSSGAVRGVSQDGSLAMPGKSLFGDPNPYRYVEVSAVGDHTGNYTLFVPNPLFTTTTTTTTPETTSNQQSRTSTAVALPFQGPISTIETETFETPVPPREITPAEPTQSPLPSKVDTNFHTGVEEITPEPNLQEGTNDRDTLRGTDVPDTLYSYGDHDQLFGMGGQDDLNAGDGHDRLYGGSGADHLFGGDGNDRLRGGAGDDELIGGLGADWADYSNASGGVRVSLRKGISLGADGADTLDGIEYVFGSQFADLIEGDAGTNDLRGKEGDDRIFGNQGTDFLYGGAGDDRLQGGTDRDELYGDQGDDTMIGERGNDYLNGGSGNDRLFGGRGNDRFLGGSGDDHYYGGEGADSFVFRSGYARDVIHDFEAGRDKLDLTSFDFVTTEDSLQSARQVLNDVIFDFGGGDQLVIQSSTLPDLSDGILI